MLSVDRIKGIEQLLEKNNSVSVNELSRAFGVSGETIRRDLYNISKKDPAIVRVYGGAYRVTPDSDPPYSFRNSSKVDEKRRIADKCFDKIEDGDHIFLDSSTTTLFLAKLLSTSGLKLTVITNSFEVIGELNSCENINLICAGGAYTKSTHSFVGNTTIQCLSGLYAVKSFISCAGIDLRFGLTHNSEEEAAVRKVMLANSKLHYLLIDSNKFGRCKLHAVSPLSREYIDTVFTDSKPEPAWIEMFARSGIALEVC